MDFAILIRVEAKSVFGSRHAHYMPIAAALQKALEKLRKDGKVTDKAITIEEIDEVALNLTEAITKTIDTKLEVRAQQLEDDYRERISDHERMPHSR